MILSIVTINRNNLEGLRKTVESVLTQTNKEFEYIVIDGASSDGSAEFIKSHSSFFAYYISEPDTGIYNAMNKGIRKASGEYVLMLNSGDYLVNSDVIEKVLPLLKIDDIIQGNTICDNETMYYINRGYGRSDLNYIDVQQGRFLHQASFCRRRLFDQYGLFDESYKISGDTVFYIRCLGKGNATFRYVDVNIAYFESGGISDSNNKAWQSQREIEFKRWSTEEFSKRQWDTCIEMDKEGRLYKKLHSHKWSWLLTMLLSRLVDLNEKIVHIINKRNINEYLNNIVISPRTQYFSRQ